MKKTLFAFMALATAFGATSCQSDEELTQPTGKPMVINAVAEGIGTGTRATMAYKYDIFWSQDDQIYVTNGTNNAAFTLQSGAGTTNGTFAHTSGSTFTSGEQVEAYYPASLVDGESLVWPAEQTASTIVPMYSKQTLGSTGTENFSFASLGAMLQIVFNTEQAGVTLKSITLKDGTNPLSGTFTVKEDGKAEMEANTDAPGITLDLGTGKALGKGANFFHIAVPAGEYSDLTITFTATDKSTCTFTGGSVTLDHNTVGRLVLTCTEFKKSGQGYADAKGIGRVKWIQLWENGPKFAEKNVGATSVTDYGGLYCWGGTYANGEYIIWNGDYNQGTDDLTGDTDTATNLWGSKWRMPTEEELKALINSTNCDIKWTDDYNGTGKAGKIFTGKGDYASNSIFLPAAGRICKSLRDFVLDAGYGAMYWSSTAKGSDEAYHLGFDDGKPFVDDITRIDNAYSVRAVLNESAE